MTFQVKTCLVNTLKMDKEETIPLQEFTFSEDDKSIVASLLQSRQACNILYTEHQEQ
jgi:hypothetical protein